MKKTKIGIQYLLLPLYLIIGVAAFSQNPDKKEKQAQQEQAIKDLVISQRFVFVPLSVTPMNGLTRQLTPDYSLTIKKDSIESYLPYYGRAYNASYGGTDDRWNFKSTHFTYKVVELKKGGWSIYIKPTDASGGQELTLRITSSGYASLQVNSIDREFISYYGTINPLK